MTPTRRKLALLSLSLLIIAVVAVVAGLWIAAVRTQTRIVQVLGPDSTSESISFTLRGITITRLRGNGPAGWPVTPAFSAERIDIRPDLRTLFDDTLLIREIVLERPYVSLQRGTDGKTRFLPGLVRQTPRDPDRPQQRTIRIARIVAHDGDLDWFDATLGDQAVRVPLDRVQAQLDDLVFPLQSQKSAFRLSGRVESPAGDKARDGDLQMEGWVDVARRDSSVQTRVRHADARTFEPYFIRRAETGIARGTLDLDLQSDVRDRYLKAPGRLALSDLDLESRDGAGGTFMGLQRKAVIGFLQDGDGRIDVAFTLEGDLGDTRFSLNEALSTKLAVGVAEVIGFSVGGVVEAVGTVGKGGVNVIVDTLKKIFGGDDEPRDKDDPEPAD